MCKATLLPDPDSPLRMMMRTPPCYPAAAALQVRGPARLWRGWAAALAAPGASAGVPTKSRILPIGLLLDSSVGRDFVGWLDAQRAHRRGVVVGALLLVLLDAAIELVRQQIDGRVHVFLGCVRVDGTTAHV